MSSVLPAIAVWVVYLFVIPCSYLFHRHAFKVKHDVALSEWLYACQCSIIQRLRYHSPADILQKIRLIFTDLSKFRYVLQHPAGFMVCKE